MPDFLAWKRPAVYALANAPRAGVRLAAQLPVTLHDDAGDVAAAASFLLAGPADVERLTAGQIVGRRPHPGTDDAEATMMAHVELAAPDLPWRYTPEPHTGAPALRPWLVLVVGTPAEVSLGTDGRVELAGATLFQQHPLSVSHRWAHVHETPGRMFSRVVSPRALQPGVEYVAALVPGWRLERLATKLSAELGPPPPTNALPTEARAGTKCGRGGRIQCRAARHPLWAGRTPARRYRAGGHQRPAGSWRQPCAPLTATPGS